MMAIAVSPKTDRALPTSAIVGEFHSGGEKAINGEEVGTGLKLAMLEAREQEASEAQSAHIGSEQQAQ